MCRARLCVYIHKLPFKKCNSIGLCFTGYTYEVRFALQGLGLDIPKGAIYTSGYEVIVGQGGVEV